MSNIKLKSVNKKTTVSRAMIRAAVADAYANNIAVGKKGATEIIVKVVKKAPAASANRVK
jgi:hypothetical protein